MGRDARRAELLVAVPQSGNDAVEDESDDHDFGEINESPAWNFLMNIRSQPSAMEKPAHILISRFSRRFNSCRSNRMNVLFLTQAVRSQDGCQENEV